MVTCRGSKVDEASRTEFVLSACRRSRLWEQLQGAVMLQSAAYLTDHL